MFPADDSYEVLASAKSTIKNVPRAGETLGLPKSPFECCEPVGLSELSRPKFPERELNSQSL